MFEQSLIVDAVSRRNPWSFAASITVQSLLVAAALVVPLLHVAKLDTKQPDVWFLPRTLKPQEQVKPVATREQSSTSTAVLRVDRVFRPFQWPSKIPDHVATGPDLPGAPEIAIGTSGNGGPVVDIGVGLPGPVVASVLLVPPPEPKPHVQKPAAPVAPLQVGTGVQSAKLVFGPRPAYPPLAKQARISGTVHLAAHIAADGHIQGLQVISGHPMLVQAALDAVRQWNYKPTLLNGEPVEVLTEIMVNFTLNP